MRLLFAEDDADLRTVTAKRLAAAGYAVDVCADGAEAWDYLTAVEDAIESGEHRGYDAVVLDIMMPYKSGLEILADLRRRGTQVPVLLLTARDAIEDRVLGLDAGADDYLVKPFAFDELAARLRVMTRKSTNNPTNLYTCGDLTLDTASRRVTRGTAEITLSAREFAILEYMIRNKNTVLSRDRIERHTRSFDDDEATSSNVTDVYIRYLRRKIDDPYPTKLIQTVRGSGYKLSES